METTQNSNREQQLLRQISLLQNVLEVFLEEPFIIEQYLEWLHPRTMNIKTDLLLLNVERSLN